MARVGRRVSIAAMVAFMCSHWTHDGVVALARSQHVSLRAHHPSICHCCVIKKSEGASLTVSRSQSVCRSRKTLPACLIVLRTPPRDSDLDAATCRSRAARDAHPLHACLPVLVEIAGQPQSDATVAALAARCASCVAVLDPVEAAGGACRTWSRLHTAIVAS